MTFGSQFGSVWDALFIFTIYKREPEWEMKKLLWGLMLTTKFLNHQKGMIFHIFGFNILLMSLNVEQKQVKWKTKTKNWSNRRVRWKMKLVQRRMHDIKRPSNWIRRINSRKCEGGKSHKFINILITICSIYFSKNEKMSINQITTCYLFEYIFSKMKCWPKEIFFLNSYQWS